jgi:cell division protein FtsB
MENLKLKHRLLQLDHLYACEKLKQELVYTHSRSEASDDAVEDLNEKRRVLRKTARQRYNAQKEQMFQMYNAKMKKLALFKGKM